MAHKSKRGRDAFVGAKYPQDIGAGYRHQIKSGIREAVNPMGHDKPKKKKK